MTKEDVEIMRKEMVFHTINFTLVRKLEYNYLAADLFQYICYWVLFNEEENKNYHDGQYWTYFSANDLVNMEFKGISKWTVQRAIWVLVDSGLVKTGNFNDKKSNHTLWYTVDKIDIEFWQPNLIKLFKKRGRKGASSAVQNCTDVQSEGGAELHQDDSKTAPTVVQNCTDSLYISNNNHTNNHSTNQEKEIIFLNNQHQQVDKVVSEDGDSSHESDSKNQYPFSAKEWQKWRTLLPKMPYSISDIEKLKEMVDEYGAESIEKNLKYFDDDYHRESMSKFLKSVEGGASSDRWEARQKKNGEYRLRW